MCGEGVLSDQVFLETAVRSPLLESLIELDQAVFDALPIGVYVCDGDGCIVRANRKAVELWGRSPRLFDPAQRFCGCFRVETLAGEFIPPDATPMARAVLDGQSFDGVEARVENPDGHRWVASVTIQALRDGAGRLVGAINCFRDITAEYEQREALIRNLAELEHAEALQQLLINELNHRVKNSLTTVQSIASQTLRAAASLAEARDAIEQRICSLARAHDLLTARNWSAVDLTDIVARAMQPFATDQIRVEGPSVDVSPQRALALSMALHELATNAAKYGALSIPSGKVELGWTALDGELHLSWTEQGGPEVQPPGRRGFGSRLLEQGLGREFGGEVRLQYPPQGVICEMAIPPEA